MEVKGVVILALASVFVFNGADGQTCNRHMKFWQYRRFLCNNSGKTEKLINDMNELKNKILSFPKGAIPNKLRVSRGCPGDYRPYKNGQYEYKICDKCVGWFRARKICQQDGGDLLTIGSDEEFDYFLNFQLEDQEGCTQQNSPWVGARDVKEGEWRWIDGKPLSKTDKHWHKDQPDNYLDEDCLHIWQRNGVTKLNDAPCKKWKLMFICQRKR